MSSVTGPNALSLTELNELPESAARQALASCCAAASWIDAIVSGRGYASVDRLLAQSDRAVAELTPDQLGDALAGHPRIGDRRAAAAGWSQQEQAGVLAAGAESAGSEGAGSAGVESAGSEGAESASTGLAAALAEGNAEYERRFGHIYLVCATGKSGEELLAILRGRLANDRETEWKVVAAELAKINQIRLRKLLGAQS